MLGGKLASSAMSDVLSDDTTTIITLGRLGWFLRRIEQATGVRREAASLSKGAGLKVRRPGGWGEKQNRPYVTTDSTPAKRSHSAPGNAEVSKPAIQMTTDSEPAKQPGNPTGARAPSYCEPYRKLIEAGLRSVAGMRWQRHARNSKD